MSSPRAIDHIGRAIDRGLGILFPGIERKRLLNRGAAGIIRERQYAAAKITASTGNWNPVNQGVNDVIGMSQYNLRARVRQLVRDMPHFDRAVRLATDYVVGEGINVTPRVLDLRSGTPQLDKRINLMIEDAWKFWMDEADVSGHDHYHELERTSTRQDYEVGESIFRQRILPDPNRFIPLSYEAIEPDALSFSGPVSSINTTLTQIAGLTSGMVNFQPQTTTNASGTSASSGSTETGNEVFLGVEVDPDTYKRVAYHFNETGTPFRTMRIPADQIIHAFETLRPKQVRGVTPFAAGVLWAHNLRDFLDAELDGAKMAARWLAFVKTADPAGAMGAMGTKDKDPRDTTHLGKVQDLGNMTIDYLYPNEEVKFASHNRPGSTFDPFTQFILRTFAVVSGFPYHLISEDYRSLPYNAQRGARNDLIMRLRPIQRRHIRKKSQRMYYSFLDWAVLAGKLDLPGYFHNPWPYRRAFYMPPGMPPIDPLREGRAAADQVKNGLLTPQEWHLSRGRDPLEVLDELEQWRREVADRELELEGTTSSKATQTNPAAVGGSEGDTNNGK